MINISIKKNSFESTNEIIIEGHANYAEHGKDIICASVSILIQTAVLALANYINSDKIEFVMEDGFSRLKVPKGKNNEEERNVKIIIDTILLGLNAIAKEYEEYVNVKEIGGGNDV